MAGDIDIYWVGGCGHAHRSEKAARKCLWISDGTRYPKPQARVLHMRPAGTRGAHDVVLGTWRNYRRSPTEGVEWEIMKRLFEVPR